MKSQTIPHCHPGTVSPCHISPALQLRKSHNKKGRPRDARPAFGSSGIDSKLEGERGERVSDLFQEEVPGCFDRSCLREAKFELSVPRVSCPGEGTFPRTFTHVCGASEVGCFYS